MLIQRQKQRAITHTDYTAERYYFYISAIVCTHVRTFWVHAIWTKKQHRYNRINYWVSSYSYRYSYLSISNKHQFCFQFHLETFIYYPEYSWLITKITVSILLRLLYLKKLAYTLVSGFPWCLSWVTRFRSLISTNISMKNLVQCYCKWLYKIRQLQ